jgi:hypothetical protein
LSGSGKLLLVGILVVAALATVWVLLLTPGDTPADPGVDSIPPVAAPTGEQGSADRETPTDVRPVEATPFRGNPDAPDGQFPAVSDERHIRGIVVDEQGRAIAGATLTLLSDRSIIRGRPEEGTVLAEGTTGPDGRYRFPLPTERGMFLVRAEHSDFATGRHTPIDAEEPATFEARLVLSKGHLVEGRVEEPSGIPVRGAVISVFDMSIASQAQDGALERRVESDGAGRFQVPHLRPGMKRLIAYKEGFARDGREPLEVPSRGKGDGLLLVLRPGKRLEGFVRDVATKAPIVAARVSARPTGHIVDSMDEPLPNPDREQPLPGGQKPPSTTWVRPMGSGGMGDPSRIPQLEVFAVTDERGHFVITDAPEALFTMQVQAPGYLFFSGRSARSGDTDLAFELTRSPLVRGRVIDGRTGLPIPEFRLIPAISATPTYLPNTGQVFAVPDGSFQIDLPRQGTWFVHAEAKGYAPAVSEAVVARLNTEEIPELVITMDRGATLRGVIIDPEGKGVQGAQVEVLSGLAAEANNPFAALFRQSLRKSSALTVRSSSDGRFLISNIAPGEYHISVSANGLAKAESQGFTLSLNQELEMPPIRLTLGGRVEGFVLTDGKPDIAAVVMLSSADPTKLLSHTAATDGEGRYRFHGLLPGDYKLVVTQRNGAIQLGDLIRSAGAADQMVRVVDGQLHEVNL